MAGGRASRAFGACAVIVLCATAARGQERVVGRQPETGREWLARCGDVVRSRAAASAQAAETRACLGWIEGLIDINEIYRGLGALEKTSEGFCTPPGATVADAAEAVARYFADHPDALDFSARILAYMALRQRFPCAPPGI
ncbi:MAG: hypothetical protein HYU37_05680 [Acidobacteria bacterium]|nr:hypothetical protein [Acidobacteriota bacterium]